MDFTIDTYKRLLTALQSGDYPFQTFNDFIQSPKQRTIILRHDVDRLPDNALRVAILEHELGIGATYYFRAVPASWDEDIIREIAGLGHEIGYHYENLSEISKGERAKRKQNRENRNEEKGKGKGQRGNGKEERGKREIGTSKQETVEKEREGREWKRGEGKEEFGEELFEFAIDDFRLNLEKLRKLYAVKTICMHGSPLSKWDNRDLWKRYNYRDYGIIAEPYFDVDFNEIFYVTDTGRKWNNSGASIRDRVDSRFDIEIKSTHHFIELIKQVLIPDKMMINVHPQRWTDRPLPWMKELIWQNVKNVVKGIIVRRFRREHRLSVSRKG